MKECSKCGVLQLLEEFAVKNKNTRTRNSWCSSCNREYQKEHYRLNKDTYRIKVREWEARNGGTFGKRLRNYSMSEEEFKKLFSKHSGKCWICRESDATQIDHDHSCCSGPKSCGKCVRGVLCASCNAMLGKVKDSKDVFTRAIEYLS